jgi:hypothetical protein
MNSKCSILKQGEKLPDPCRESRTLSYGIIKQPSACNSEMLGLD